MRAREKKDPKIRKKFVDMRNASYFSRCPLGSPSKAVVIGLISVAAPVPSICSWQCIHVEVGTDGVGVGRSWT